MAESQSRLGVDRFDLVYIHDPERITYDEAMGPGGPTEALEQLRDEGVIGHIGVAGGPVDMLRRYVASGRFEVVITHNRWTLADRSAEPLLDEAGEAGVAVVNGAPFGGGIFVKGPDAQPMYAYQSAPAPILEAIRDMEAACREADVPLAAAALAVLAAGEEDRFHDRRLLQPPNASKRLWSWLAGRSPTICGLGWTASLLPRKRGCADVRPDQVGHSVQRRHQCLRGAGYPRRRRL